MFDADQLKPALYQRFNFQANQRFAVAYSGGADSTALIVALREVFIADSNNNPQSAENRLVAFHFNHGMVAQSEDWQQHCQQLCDRLFIPMLTSRWPQDAAQLITEDDARQARYKWFSKILEPDQVLLTAHHCDDQAETILMNLVQGAGPERLAGIPPMRSLAGPRSGKVCRPLLAFSRDDLVSYLKIQGCSWIEDSSNLDLKHNRNYLRHQVIPLIKQRWPKMNQGVSRSGFELSRQNEILDTAMYRLFQTRASPAHRRLFCLCDPIQIVDQQKLSTLEWIAMIRQWVKQCGFAPPENPQINDLLKSDSTDIQHYLGKIKIRWKALQIRGFAGYLHLLPANLPLDPKQGGEVARGCQNIGNLRITFELSKNGGIDRELLNNAKLIWRWRAGGEHLQLPGRQHHTSMKKAYQQYAIPTWERKRLPFLTLNDEIIWVYGIGLCGSAHNSANFGDGVLPQFALTVAN